MRLPLLQPALVERLGVPGRIVQEVVQRLPVGARHDRRQLHQRLVVLARQQQPDQVVAEARAPRAAEQLVKGAQNWSIASVVGGMDWRGVGMGAPPGVTHRAPFRLLLHLPHPSCHC